MIGETIAAIATAPGRGGVAIVRVSGPDAFAVARRVTGREPAVGRVQFVSLPEDECVCLAFHGPRSYTGEDVVELQCHGGVVAPRRVLAACFSAGARLARRGEFTQRAYLNGRLDYEQAESVLALIEAKTDRAAEAARAGLAGRTRRETRTLYEAALALSTELEHALDIDEGELPSSFFTRNETALARLRDDLQQAVARAREGKILREGALVVLAGPPNAGKSSLMNALLQENRAIVSDTPGTTRDTIEEWLDLSGWPVRLVDTAGLRQTDDAIEAEGVRRTEALMAQADIVLRLGAADDVECSARDLRIHAKCDLGCGTGLNVSALTGEGLSELKAAIVARLERQVSDGPVSEASGQLASEVYQALSLLPEGLGDIVLAANQVRRVATLLGEAIGATYSSDLLDCLFSRFCVGK